MREIGKAFLRQVALLPQFADTGSKPLEGRMAGGLPSLGRHGQDAGLPCPLGPRPIGYNVDVGPAADYPPRAMVKAEIKPGNEYALREGKTSGPIQHVRVLEHIRGNRWKAEWIEPNPGLVHYVESGHLLALWKEHKAVLKEQANAERQREHNAECGYVNDSPVDRALYEVFENVGDAVSYYRGVLCGRPDALNRIKTRADVSLERTSPVEYVDRTGVVHLPFDEAVEIARKFCEAEPAVVLADVEATEREWAREATLPGEKHRIRLLNEYRASWALLRQWAGQDAAIAQREAEIQRLERLVWDAVYALQKAGLEKECARLRRAIEKG